MLCCAQRNITVLSTKVNPTLKLLTLHCKHTNGESGVIICKPLSRRLRSSSQDGGEGGRGWERVGEGGRGVGGVGGGGWGWLGVEGLEGLEGLEGVEGWRGQSGRIIFHKSLS